MASSHLFFDIDRLRPQPVNLITARPQPTTSAATFYDESVVISVKILRRQSRSVLRRQLGREHLNPAKTTTSIRPGTAWLPFLHVKQALARTLTHLLGLSHDKMALGDAFLGDRRR